MERTNSSVVWFVLQDDYIPYPSIDEVGAPLAALQPDLGPVPLGDHGPSQPHMGENLGI